MADIVLPDSVILQSCFLRLVGPEVTVLLAAVLFVVLRTGPEDKE